MLTYLRRKVQKGTKIIQTYFIFIKSLQATQIDRFFGVAIMSVADLTNHLAVSSIKCLKDKKYRFILTFNFHKEFNLCEFDLFIV